MNWTFLFTNTSVGSMMPLPFLSANVKPRWKRPRIGRPTESRLAPVPMVGFGRPVFSSKPSDSILFVLCEPPIVMSQPKLRRSRMVVVTVASRPELRTEPRFFVMLSDDEPDDAAIGCE